MQLSMSIQVMSFINLFHILKQIPYFTNYSHFFNKTHPITLYTQLCFSAVVNLVESKLPTETISFNQLN